MVEPEVRCASRRRSTQIVRAGRNETNSGAAELYLDLLKKCLTRYIFEDGALDQNSGRLLPFDPELRAEGRDWPATAETMVGLRRLDNVQHCVIDVLRRGVPGDLVETGVWRGGVAILMRGVLKAFGTQTASFGRPIPSKAFRSRTQTTIRPMRAIDIGPFPISQPHLKRSKGTSPGSACSTNTFVSFPAGSETHCRTP